MNQRDRERYPELAEHHKLLEGWRSPLAALAPSSEAYRRMLGLTHRPVALIFFRQALPTVDRAKFSPVTGLAKGAYILVALWTTRST
jgi:hypothetical protein